MNKGFVIGMVIFMGISGSTFAGGIKFSPGKASIGPSIVLKGIYGERACFKIDNSSRFVKEGKELYPGITIEKISEGGSRVILSTPKGREVLKIGESLSGDRKQEESKPLTTPRKGKLKE